MSRTNSWPSTKRCAPPVPNSPRAIATLDTLLLVVLNGCEFPQAMQALRRAGFKGDVWTITHQEWVPIVEGGCGKVLPFPPSSLSAKKRGFALLRLLLKFGNKADGILWVSPPRKKLAKFFNLFAARGNIYSFYDGRPGPYQPGQAPSLPGAGEDAIREDEAALRYLRPVLTQNPTEAPTLRLGVDGDGIHMREATGVQWYRRHLFASLCDARLGVDLRVVSPTAEARNIWETPWSNRMHRVPPPLARHAPSSRENAVPIEAVTGPIDLFHLTFFDPPRFSFKKAVATVYDITPLALPDAFPERFMARLRAIEPFWRDECARLLCISEATRADLETHMGIPKSRTVCIPPGKHPHFAPRSKSEIAEALQRHGIRQPYFMALGSIAPHKNLEGLCEAFASARARFERPHQLVIVGRPAWMMKDVLDKMAKSGMAGDVIFTGYADWWDLPALYSGAAAFCMPSLYEGYGLPVQEAMCCGCPVILSDCTSLPEVAGDAGLYCNPKDPEDIADKMVRIANDETARPTQSKSVLAQARTFPTWHDVALAHKQVYEDVIGTP